MLRSNQLSLAPRSKNRTAQSTVASSVLSTSLDVIVLTFMHATIQRPLWMCMHTPMYHALNALHGPHHPYAPCHCLTHSRVQPHGTHAWFPPRCAKWCDCVLCYTTCIATTNNLLFHNTCSKSHASVKLADLSC